MLRGAGNLRLRASSRHRAWSEGLGSLVVKRNPTTRTSHCGGPSAPVWTLTLRLQRWFPSAPPAISHRLGQDFSKTEPRPGQQFL